jgi:hypothetical protein
MTKKANNIQAHVGTIKRSITINTSDIPELFRKSTKFFRAEKKKIKKSDIQCPISDTFVRINHIGLSNNNNFVVNMNQKNEHFTMILEVLEKLDIKPNKQSLSYVDKVIQSCGGYKQMYDSYSHYKIQKTRTTLSPLMNKQVERIEKTRHSKPFAPIKPACNEEDFKRSLTENKSVLKIVQTLENRPPSQSSLASSNLEVAKTDETVTECNIYLCQSPKSNFNKDDNNNIKPALLPKPENNENLDIRNQLLESISNFKGKLKHVQRNSLDVASRQAVTASGRKIFNENEQVTMINQLFKALDDMRPFLNFSSESDEQSESDDDFGKEN